jgi:TPR repeat protein
LKDDMLDSYYRRGRELCLQRNWKDGMSVLRYAARGGHIHAAFDIGWWYIEMDKPEESIGWFEIAANSGHVEAMYRLGLAYGRLLDLSRASYWWHVAAANGHEDAAKCVSGLAAE